MGCARACHDCVDRLERSACPVCVDQFDLRPNGERRFCLPGQSCVDLDCGDPPGFPDKLGDDGGIVPGAAAEVKYLLPEREIEMVEQIGPKARLSIVDTARLIERD